MKAFLNTPIHQYLFGKDNPKPGDIGVEIEAEFLKAINIEQRLTHWAIKEDRSLRNIGVEYVLRGPYAINKFKKDAIEEWRKYAEGKEFYTTARTSVHVHLNCQAYTGLQVFTFLTAAWFLEDFIVAFCAPQREGNVFCLRTRDAEYPILSLMAEMSKGLHQPQDFFRDSTRYAAINGKALKDFGSIEFRCMRGIYDADDIRYWVDFLHSLKLKTEAFKYPKEIIKLYLEVPKRRFLSTFLDENMLEFATRQQGWEEILDDKFLLLNAFANEVEFILQKPDVLKTPGIFINEAAVFFNDPNAHAPQPWPQLRVHPV